MCCTTFHTGLSLKAAASISAVNISYRNAAEACRSKMGDLSDTLSLSNLRCQEMKEKESYVHRAYMNIHYSVHMFSHVQTKTSML